MPDGEIDAETAYQVVHGAESAVFSHGARPGG